MLILTPCVAFPFSTDPCRVPFSYAKSCPLPDYLQNPSSSLHKASILDLKVQVDSMKAAQVCVQILLGEGPYLQNLWFNDICCTAHP